MKTGKSRKNNWTLDTPLRGDTMGTLETLGFMNFDNIWEKWSLD